MNSLFVYHAWMRTTFTWVALSFAAYGILGIFNNNISPYWLILSYLVNQVFMITMSVGNHRLFSHAAFQCSRFWHWFFAIISVVSGNNSAYIWTYIHRGHHRFADTPNDPYENNFHYFFRRKHKAINFEIPKVKFMLKDPVHYFTHKYALLWILVTGIILYTVSPTLFIFGYMLPAAWHHITGGLLIIFTHKNGEAVDRPWYWGILLPSSGEWYHRAHHEPGKAKRLNNALRPKQWDFGYWFSKAIAKPGSIKLDT